MTTFGRPDGLRFEVAWEATPERSVDGTTRARLRATVCGQQVWPHANSDGEWVTWGLGPMLDGLRRRWPALRYAQGLPLDLQCSLREVRAVAEARWAATEGDDARIDEESEIVESFLSEHDLADAVGGLRLPELLVVREGHLCRVATDRGEFVLPWVSTWQTIEALGEAIDQRLEPLDDDPLALALRSGWAQRRRVDRAAALSAMTSNLLPGREALVRELLEPGDTAVEVLEQSPILAVARMSSAVVDLRAVRTICQHAAATTAGGSEQLDRWCAAVRVRLPSGWTSDVPHGQAAALAAAVRAQLGAERGARVDIAGALAALGVEVRHCDFATGAVDAIAVWSAGLRPTVLLNSARRANVGRVRATLAHELCHLLVDRDAALPVAEVVDGRMLEAVEQRARAFAAELLAPKDELLPLFVDAATSVQAQSVLRRVTARLGVSAQLVAWQVSNRARELGVVLWPEVEAVLRRARRDG